MVLPYSGSMRPNASMTPVYLPAKRKKGWSKTVVVVSLKKRDSKGSSMKGNSKVVLLDSSPCTICKVTDLVSKQVGVHAIFLYAQDPDPRRNHQSSAVQSPPVYLLNVTRSGKRYHLGKIDFEKRMKIVGSGAHKGYCVGYTIGNYSLSPTFL